MDDNLIRCAEIMRVFQGNINGLSLTLQYYTYPTREEAIDALEDKLSKLNPANRETIDCLHKIVCALNQTTDEEYKWAKQKIRDSR